MTGDSFLSHLPPVLWNDDPPDGEFSLRGLLRITEKLLRGIDDSVPCVHSPPERPAHAHDGIEQVLDRLPELLDPYRTPVRFLPWLAGWVGLVLPPSWSVPQQRTAIARMAGTAARRGLKDGLTRYLDLYTVSEVRPRITVDDGARLLFATPEPDRVAPLHTLLAHGPFLRADGTAGYAGVAHPRCLAATPDGHLLLGDGGLRGDADSVKPALWRVSRTGAYLDQDTTAPDPAQPRAPRPGPLGRKVVPPAGQPQWELGRPEALAVDDRVTPWRVYLVDGEALYLLDSAKPDELRVIATAEQLSMFAPDAMVLGAPGHLTLLDSNTVLDIDVTTSPARLVSRRALRTDGADLGLVARSMVALGPHLVVGDVRSQESDPADADPGPGDLVLVDRSDPANWTQRRLLRNLPAGRNPLVAPMALRLADPTTLLVLDIGLRPYADPANQTDRVHAEPSAVYRARLDLAAGVVTGVDRVTESGWLTFPRDLVQVEDVLYVCDQGEPESTDLDLRARAGRFGVFVHFSRQRPPPGEGQLPLIMRNIADMVSELAPATAAAWLNWQPVEPG